MELTPELQKLIADFFNRELISIKPETSINDIEEWDSLEHIKLILEIEDKFKIRFHLEVVPLLTSVESIQIELNKLV